MRLEDLQPNKNYSRADLQEILKREGLPWSRTYLWRHEKKGNLPDFRSEKLQSRVYNREQTLEMVMKIRELEKRPRRGPRYDSQE